MNTTEKIKILGHSAILAKLDRMAWEIFESNYSEKEIVIAGIDVRGGFLAEQLASRLRVISPLKVTVINLPRNSGTIIINSNESLQGKSVLIVDDVLYTGVTIFQALGQLMSKAPAKVHTAVLIDRGHRNMPVSADFVGMVLATTLRQHVSVEVTENGRVDTYIN